MQRQGVVSSVGNHDFFFVTDLETSEIFFCHNSRVKDGAIPNEGAKVAFDHLEYERNGRRRPIVKLEVLDA